MRYLDPRISVIAVLFLLLTGCSGTYSTRDGDGETGGTEVYPLSMDDALLIMQDAMQKEFPEDRIEDIFTPHRGYRAKMRFLADIDVISVYAIPGQGRGPDGKTVDGLVFEVHRSGTYPLGGIPRSKAVLKRVVAGASRMADALPKIE
ncbi:MAG TPA: hypothetical protein ENK05_04300 [Gammaproteobacteria bacterium]|nr:hypothetical protein [Gammaproteobacteria bacterium]